MNFFIEAPPKNHKSNKCGPSRNQAADANYSPSVYEIDNNHPSGGRKPSKNIRQGFSPLLAESNVFYPLDEQVVYCGNYGIFSEIPLFLTQQFTYNYGYGKGRNQARI